MNSGTGPGIGMPARLKLEWFGREVYDAFGSHAYLVGTAARSKTWRDVDVRVILDDEDFERQIGKLTRPNCLNLRWNALCLAFAARGREVTGLPIDFQIQQRSDANEQYRGEVRHALGLVLEIGE